jgi:dolichol-phosphate mannosyltransferase
MSTLIAIATYNERENLPRLIESIRREAPEVHVLVVDDNSPDGTGQWCDDYAASDRRVVCLHRSSKLGLGTATVAGLRYAIDHDYRYVVTMDADLSHPPRYVPQMLRAMDDPESGPVDVVIGSRYVPGGGIEGWPWRRRLMSRGINAFARWWLGLPVRDTSGAFRCYRTSVLREINLQRVQSRGYSVFEELLWRLKCHGARMIELPITFVDRHHGRSKITWREACSSLTQLVRLRRYSSPTAKVASSRTAKM